MPGDGRTRRRTSRRRRRRGGGGGKQSAMADSAPAPAGTAAESAAAATAGEEEKGKSAAVQGFLEFLRKNGLDEEEFSVSPGLSVYLFVCLPARHDGAAVSHLPVQTSSYLADDVNPCLLPREHGTSPLPTYLPTHLQN